MPRADPRRNAVVRPAPKSVRSGAQCSTAVRHRPQPRRPPITTLRERNSRPPLQTENAPVLDDSVSSLLFSVPDDSTKAAARKAVRCISLIARPSRRSRSFWCARSRRSRPTPQAHRCARLRRQAPTGTVTRVTVWIDGKDIVFVSSTDAQYYRVPDAAAEFCRLTGLPENRA